MSDIQFVEGIYFNKPSDKAPDFIKINLKLERDRLIKWLQAQEPEINVQVKEAKSGKWYGAVDTWKPAAKKAPEPELLNHGEDLPF